MRSGLVQYHDSLLGLMEPIESLVPHPENYNKGSVDDIMDSIGRVGMYRPIIVARDSREIIAGNHTWLACKTMGATQIPVVWFDGETTEQLIALVGDNVIAAKATIDDAQLLSIMEELESMDEMLGTGIEEPDLADLRKSIEKAEAKDVAEAKTKIAKAEWPTLFISVPPETKMAFYEMTEDIEGNDRERLEAIMRKAGWRG